MARAEIKRPFRYEPCGDSDGETHGIDHFVVDAEGFEIACPPDEETARLLAASADLLAACERTLADLDQNYLASGGRLTTRGQEIAALMRAAVAKAKGED